VKKLVWWFRCVGAFYFLLSLVNLYSVLSGDGSWFKSTIPYPAEDLVVRAFMEGWSPFAFEILGLGTFMLWASRNPGRYLGSVWLIVWLEFWHGVADDIYLISHGYDLVGYLVFIAIHFLIIVTGVLFVREAEREKVAALGQ
jgi:hypothetical protein